MKDIKIYRKDNKGITLIALIISIIVIIILTGISTSLLLPNGGIFQRAKEQKEEQRKAQILEELELAKGPVTIDGEGNTNLKKYLEAIRDIKLANTYEVTSVEQIDEANAIIWVDGRYKYTAAQIGIDVIINAEGYIGKLKPEIKVFNIIGKTSNSISVEVNGILAEEYEFYISENNSDYEKMGEIKTNKGDSNEIQIIEYTYENLIATSEGKNYYLKVVAKNRVGETEKTIEEETDIIPAPTIMVENASEWTNVAKEITITEKDGYIVKYTIDETIPSASNGIAYTGEFTVDKNCIITAVYLDSTNQIGSIATNEITRIDKKAPQGEIKIDAITTNSIKITMNVKDEEATKENGCSGIKGYYYSKDGETYTEITNNATYEFIDLSQTKYYDIKVKVEDNAGNEIVLEKRESTTTVPVPTITVANEETWTNTSKSVSINQTNGYAIKYTTNGSIPSVSNGTTYTGSFTVNQNCTIKALYVDSKNQIGSTSEKQVTKIDKTEPKEAKIEISGSTTQASLPITLNAKVTHEDLESGVNINSCRYVLNTTSAEIGTNANSYTGGTFSSNGQTITINPSSVANWYLHVLTIDNAGNKKEKIKEIGIIANYHTHTGSSSSGGGCYTKQITNNKLCNKTLYLNGGDGQNSFYVYCPVHGYITNCHYSSAQGGAFGAVDVQAGRITCTKVISTTYTYNLGCGKTETTLEGYRINY